MSQKSTLSIKEASYDTIDYNNSSQQSNWFTNLTNGDCIILKKYVGFSWQKKCGCGI